MKRLLFIVCLLIISQMAFATSQTIKNEDFGFSLTLPDGWTVVKSPIENALLFAEKSGSNDFMFVMGNRESEGRGYIMGEKIKYMKEEALQYEAKYGWEFIDIEYEPFYNVLRHSLSFHIYKRDRNIHQKELQIVHGRDCIGVNVYISGDDLSEADSILDSITIDYTTLDHFKQAKMNIGGFIGSMFLTLYPLLGFYTGYFRKKWRWYRGDKTSKWSFFGCLLGSMLLFAAVVVMLKDCMTLMGCVVGVLLLFWIGFFLDNKFFAGMYKGLFGA